MLKTPPPYRSRLTGGWARLLLHPERRFVYLPSFDMPKATREQQELYEKTVQVAAYRPRLSDPKHRLRLVEMDEVPPEDAQGRRRADGWKAVWEGVVDSGGYLGVFAGRVDSQGEKR